MSKKEIGRFKHRHYTYAMFSDGTWGGPMSSLYARVRGIWVEWKWRRGLKKKGQQDSEISR